MTFAMCHSKILQYFWKALSNLNNIIVRRIVTDLSKNIIYQKQNLQDNQSTILRKFWAELLLGVNCQVKGTPHN